MRTSAILLRFFFLLAVSNLVFLSSCFNLIAPFPLSSDWSSSRFPDDQGLKRGWHVIRGSTWFLQQVHKTCSHNMEHFVLQQSPDSPTFNFSAAFNLVAPFPLDGHHSPLQGFLFRAALLTTSAARTRVWRGVICNEERYTDGYLKVGRPEGSSQKQ